MKILRRYDVTENVARGKGSHRLLMRKSPTSGRKLRYPIAAHNRKHEHAARIVAAVRRALELSEEHGVSDAEFYG